MQRPFLVQGTFFRFQVIAILAFSFLNLNGCTSSEVPKKPVGQPGRFVYTFELSDVTEVSIAKNDPETADRWSADLVRIAAKSKYDDATWEIRSNSQGLSLQDRQADVNLINHLLDTLKTVQFSGPASRGPLASFGLEPPRYAIRWKSQGRSMELRIGDATQGSEAAFFGQVSSEAGLIESTPIVLKGSTQRLLGYVTSFSKLRRQTISMLASDDVDEIDLKRGTKTLLYAQRDGDDWTDRGHKKIKKTDVGKLLNQFTHARIKNFIDEPELTQEIEQTIKKSPAFEATLTPRKGDKKIMRFAWYKPKGTREAKLWASDSARNGAVFETYPEILHFFELPEK